MDLGWSSAAAAALARGAPEVGGRGRLLCSCREGVIFLVKHALVPAPADVGERVKRTAAQVGVPAFVFLVVVLPSVIEVIDQEVGEMLPPGFRLVMLGAATVLTAVSVAVTRIMALPVVNDWLSRWTPFGTSPPAEAKAIRADGYIS